MSDYTFLKPANDFEGVYYAIPSERIETINVSDTYDQYGQSVSAEDAGDYIEILSQECADSVNEEFDESYEVGTHISAFSEGNEFYHIESLFVEDVDYRVYRETIEGFNYWDGSNWKTIVVSGDYPTHEIEEDEEIVKRLNDALENKQYVSDGFGIETYESDECVIELRQFSSAWETYTIEFK